MSSTAAANTATNSPANNLPLTAAAAAAAEQLYRSSPETPAAGTGNANAVSPNTMHADMLTLFKKSTPKEKEEIVQARTMKQFEALLAGKERGQLCTADQEVKMRACWSYAIDDDPELSDMQKYFVKRTTTTNIAEMNAHKLNTAAKLVLSLAKNDSLPHWPEQLPSGSTSPIPLFLDAVWKHSKENASNFTNLKARNNHVDPERPEGWRSKWLHIIIKHHDAEIMKCKEETVSAVAKAQGRVAQREKKRKEDSVHGEAPKFKKRNDFIGENLALAVKEERLRNAIAVIHKSYEHAASRVYKKYENEVAERKEELSVLKMSADTSLGGTPEDRIALRTALAEYVVWMRERLVTHNKEVDDLGVEVDEKVKVEQSTQEQLVSSSSFSSDTDVTTETAAETVLPRADDKEELHDVRTGMPFAIDDADFDEQPHEYKVCDEYCEFSKKSCITPGCNSTTCHKHGNEIATMLGVVVDEQAGRYYCFTCCQREVDWRKTNQGRAEMG
jgi:hypothetical protein